MKTLFFAFRCSFVALIFSLFTITGQAQSAQQWQAGQVLSTTALGKINIDSCFTASPITDQIFKRIWLKSLKRDCTVPTDDLRYLRVLHINKDGHTQMGELICNKAIAQDLLDIFRKLYQAGYRIEKMRLVDEYDADDERSMADNNTSCFNFRKIAGSQKLSYHSQGLAIDINTRYNPCLNTRTGLVQPANGKRYAHHRINKKNQPIRFIDKNDLCYKLFIERGFTWGGSWNNPKDYQHFEKRNP